MKVLKNILGIFFHLRLAYITSRATSCEKLFKPYANCWMWSKEATKCDWGGAELISHHPGAQMIRCQSDPGKIIQNFIMHDSILLKRLTESHLYKQLVISLID